MAKDDVTQRLEVLEAEYMDLVMWLRELEGKAPGTTLRNLVAKTKPKLVPIWDDVVELREAMGRLVFFCENLHERLNVLETARNGESPSHAQLDERLDEMDDNAAKLQEQGRILAGDAMRERGRLDQIAARLDEDISGLRKHICDVHEYQGKLVSQIASLGAAPYRNPVDP